jgi:hypothetical protein
VIVAVCSGPLEDGIGIPTIHFAGDLWHRDTPVFTEPTSHDGSRAACVYGEIRINLSALTVCIAYDNCSNRVIAVGLERHNPVPIPDLN